MDPQQLQAFVEIAETGSFSDSANTLGLTQPAISKRIASLESELSQQLFDRFGRTVSLTEAGKALLPRAKTILFELRDTKRALSNLQDTASGTLTMGTSHHIGLHRLPPILREYSDLYPGVKLDMKFIDSEQAFDGIVQGSMELGIVTLPASNELPAPMVSDTLWHDPLVVMVHHQHPLLSATETVSLSTLAQFPAILPSDTTFTRRIVTQLFQQKQVMLNVSMSTNYLETIKMMVSIGLGWSLLPKSMLDDSVTSLDVEGCQLHRNLGVIIHPDHSLSKAAKAMLDLLVKRRDIAVNP